MTPELRLACDRSIHVVTADGEVIAAGRAAMFVLRQLGWNLTGRFFSMPPMIWGVELGYAFVAANRAFFSRRFFRKP